MCRWIAYSGAEIFIDHIVTAPGHSLIEQAHSADKAKTKVNGDGFGMAWYGAKPTPALYRDNLPAWADPNLISIARHVKSPLFFAHVRASTSGSLSRDNCHPFVHDHWAFMHNGQIGDYPVVRRTLEAGLSHAAYAARIGNTDSELIFKLAIDRGLEIDPVGAFARALATVEEAALLVGVKPLIRFTSAFTDGKRLFAVRYASDRFAPSLFWTRVPASHGICVASEPFDDESQAWTAVPSGHCLTIINGDVTMVPFAPAGPVRKTA
ncbi:MAG: class II glutamine amidotransferase [Pseudomonadota bacterium]